MYGNLCGQDNTQRTDLPEGWKEDCSDKPYLYYPTPFDLDIQLCVKECPKYYFKLNLNYTRETSFFDVSKYICEYGVEPSILELNSRCWPVYQSYPGYQLTKIVT